MPQRTIRQIAPRAPTLARKIGPLISETRTALANAGEDQKAGIIENFKTQAQELVPGKGTVDIRAALQIHHSKDRTMTAEVIAQIG